MSGAGAIEAASSAVRLAPYRCSAPGGHATLVGAVAEDGDAPTGPLCAAGPRTGTAQKQYCWWITMSFPYPETVARLGLKTPDDFTPDTFLEMVLAAHVAR